jgi:hypothetical protein
MISKISLILVLTSLILGCSIPRDKEGAIMPQTDKVSYEGHDYIQFHLGYGSIVHDPECRKCINMQLR